LKIEAITLKWKLGWCDEDDDGRRGIYNKWKEHGMKGNLIIHLCFALLKLVGLVLFLEQKKERNNEERLYEFQVKKRKEFGIN